MDEMKKEFILNIELHAELDDWIQYWEEEYLINLIEEEC